MKAFGAVLIVVAIALYFFTGSIPGFEGKQVYLAGAVGVFGVVLLALGFYQDSPKRAVTTRQHTTAGGAVEEDRVEHKPGI